MIFVYSKSACPQCDKLKAGLKIHGTEYTEVRVDQDADAMKFVREAGHRSVPQVYSAYCGGEYIGQRMVDVARFI